MKRLIHCLQTVAALLLLTFLAGCEKPRLKSQGQAPEETEPGVVAEEGAKVPIEKPESRGFLENRKNPNFSRDFEVFVSGFFRNFKIPIPIP